MQKLDPNPAIVDQGIMIFIFEWRLVLILASSPTLFSRYKHVTRVFKYSGCGINTWLLILGN